MYHIVKFLPPANVVREGYVFTLVCDSVNRGGMHGCSQGGMCGCSEGVCGCSGGLACMVAPGGHVWLLKGGCAWLLRGVHGCLGGGHVWDMMRYRDMVNERAVRILLECILVKFGFAWHFSFSLPQS